MADQHPYTRNIMMNKESALQLILDTTNNFKGYSTQQKNKILMNMAENDQIAFDEIIFHNKKRRTHTLKVIRCRDISDVHNIHLTEWFELILILYIESEKCNRVLVFGDNSEKVKEAVSFIETTVEEEMEKEKEISVEFKK